jgi:hypothetical protein
VDQDNPDAAYLAGSKSGCATTGGTTAGAKGVTVNEEWRRESVGVGAHEETGWDRTSIMMVIHR